MSYIKMLDGIDPNWSITEKAKYIYESIGKSVCYDERFEYGKDIEVLKSIYYKDIDLEKDEDRRVVCNSVNNLFLKLLQKEGIKAKVIYKKSKIKRPIDLKDAALIFWDEQGNKYYTSLVGDIENCRYGLKTEFFGITENEYEEAQDVKKISDDEHREIDEKIGYIKNGEYSDVAFELLVNEMKNTNYFKKFLKSKGIDVDTLDQDQVMKLKMKYISALIKFKDIYAGPSEMKKFYKKLLKDSIFDKFENRKFKVYQYWKKEKDDIDVFLCIEINLDAGPLYYVFSNDERTYIPISDEEILEKIDGYSEKYGKKLAIEQRNDEEIAI